MNSVPKESTPKHLAWLLPFGTLFFLGGILLGRAASGWQVFLPALGFALLAGHVSHGWRRFGAAMMSALALGALLGWHGYHPALPAEGTYTLRGAVTQEVFVETDGQVKTVLSDVTLNGQPQRDAYWTYYLHKDESPPEWLIPGAQVELTAQIYHPSGPDNPGGFNFKEYLLQRNIHLGAYGDDGLTQIADGFSLKGAMAKLRHTLSLGLMDAMGPEAGAYATAMLLGARDFIPEDDRAAFNELGIAHILSVSGYHVGVLVGLLAILLRPMRLGRRSRIALEMLVLLVYALLTGGNAPVVRATGLLLWREYTRLRGRKVLPEHILCVTALMQLAVNPTLLTGPSFQLTYGAMLGLLLVFPRMKRRLDLRHTAARKIWEAFCAAAAAQLGILAPQLYWFGELPILSIVLNMAVMALASGLMTLYWATLAALPIPGLRTLLGQACAWATDGMLDAVRWLSDLEFTTLWTRQADFLTVTGWILLLWSLSICVPRRLEKLRRPARLLGIVLTLTLLIPLPREDTTYIQFDVGNADAAILEDRGMTVVIDVGEDGQAVAGYLHQRRQGVDALIITHLHTDHAGGIRALLDEEIPVKTCYLPVDAYIPVIDENILPLLDELAATGTKFRTLHRGDSLSLPSGCIDVLWPEATRVFPWNDANDVCLALRLNVAGVNLLHMADLTGAYEKYAALPADILKVAHHGSKSATSAEFLMTVAPQMLLLSNSSDAREIRMADLAGDTPLCSTAQCGGIILRFLGEGRYLVETAGDSP